MREAKEEGSSFVVRDRRGQTSQEAAQEGKSAPEPSVEKGTEGIQTQKAEPSPSTGQTEKDVQIDFSSFILSLGTSALIHLGEETDPATGQKTVALPHAKQVIDLISLLQEKTAGNLSKEEEHFITQLLFTLRMKFVALEKKRSS